MSFLPHTDTGADHVRNLINDFQHHTPDEQAHIMKGIFEEGASMILSTSGDPTMKALGRQLDAQANTDMQQGHLNFQDYSDIFQTIDHFT
ncbi:MAG TPA: hypothetical protein V6C69_03395 [Trichormus sp.]|jgi:hypothetical protein